MIKLSTQWKDLESLICKFSFCLFHFFRLIGVINDNQDTKKKKIDEKLKDKTVKSKNSALIDHYCKLILIEMAHI